MEEPRNVNDAIEELRARVRVLEEAMQRVVMPVRLGPSPYIANQPRRGQDEHPADQKLINEGKPAPVTIKNADDP
jgi:hypothetical protein